MASQTVLASSNQYNEIKPFSPQPLSRSKKQGKPKKKPDQLQTGHRKKSSRKTSRYISSKGVNGERYYFPSETEFELRLKAYNEKDSTKNGTSDTSVCSRFQCVGSVNVNMCLCSRCGDAKKEYKLERYYVDVLEKAHMRTTLCHGCMGKMLMDEDCYFKCSEWMCPLDITTHV